MRYRILFVMIFMIVASVFSEGNDSITGPVNDAVTTDTTLLSDSSVNDSLSATEAVPRCTLEVTTTPAEVTVMLDDTVRGLSPLQINSLDTGKYTLILKKAGYYQKKVVITLSVPGKTVLPIKLLAPGRLEIITEPAGATIMVNGKDKGVTPYIDSLLKPASYRIELLKEHYTAIHDTVMVAESETTTVTDTLLFTDEYRDSLQRVNEAVKRKKKRLTIGILSGAFGLFLLILACIELQEEVQ